MDRWYKKATTLALCGVFALAACGGDSDSNPAANDAEEAVITEGVIQIMGVLLQSFQTVFLQVLVQPEGTLPGPGGGSVEVSGNEWVLKDYSPDGELKLNGVLTVTIDRSTLPQVPPFPVTGSVEITSITTTSMALDLLVTLGADGSLSSTGTVTINGVEYDARTLFDAVSAAQAAAAGAGG